jgi:LPS sulfotransferase NodH
MTERASVTSPASGTVDGGNGPSVPQPTLNYLVLATPRSGSTMLCSALTASGNAGEPLEFLHPNRVDPYVGKKGHWSIPEYMADMTARHTTPNGYFGFKIHGHHYEHFFGSNRDAGLAFLRQFHRFIRVYRRNKVDQAISDMLANERQVWNITDPARRPPERDFRPDDVERIASSLAQIAHAERILRDAAVPFRSMTLDIAYEDLVADQEGEIARAMVHLDLEIDLGNLPKPTTLKVSGDRTRRMRDDFLRSIDGGAGGLGAVGGRR